MTSAPPCLLAARALILDVLGPHGLSGASVGIVGDAAHRGGYHCGRDRVLSDDYSTRTFRDRAGLCDYSSALDVGWFEVGRHNLRTFSVWLVAQCRAGAADTRDIREVIYSPDGKVVRRWDREGRSSTGDSSHLWHTHISYYRDATKAGHNLADLFRRYLTEIGLIKAATPPGDDLPTPEDVWALKAREYIDEDGSGTRDARTMKDFLVSTHAAAVTAADPERVARALAPLLPPGTGVSQADLVAALRQVFAGIATG